MLCLYMLILIVTFSYFRVMLQTMLLCYFNTSWKYTPDLYGWILLNSIVTSDVFVSICTAVSFHLNLVSSYIQSKHGVFVCGVHIWIQMNTGTDILAFVFKYLWKKKTVCIWIRILAQSVHIHEYIHKYFTQVVPKWNQH